MEKMYRIGTRKSSLALKQVEEILKALRNFCPDFSAKIIGMDTYGDKDRNTPISSVEGSDFFTREIDEALLDGNIDFAVHSAKDVPDILRKELKIAAITASIDAGDVLVSPSGLKLHELPFGSSIGTSSKRRKTQLKQYRSDFKIVNLRGTIEERLHCLDETGLGAIVIAAAGLVRLGLEDKITQRIPFDIVQPHPLQGALAIVTRRDNKEIIDLFGRLNTHRG